MAQRGRLDTPDASLSRRVLLAGLCSVGAATAAQAQAPAAVTPSKLMLLGTGGGPVLAAARGMASNLILVGEIAYLIDCGYGASGALARAGVSHRQIKSVFITHNHADHMLDYGSVLFFEWLQGRTQTIDVYGPAPLQDITNHLLAANTPPLDYYKVDMAMGPMPRVAVHETPVGGLVMQDENVRVTCVDVPHPPVPARAYRFDLKDRSIVFSGDTRPSPELVKLAQGADILVHEATDAELTLSMMKPTTSGAVAMKGAPGGFDPQKFSDHVYQAHTRAEDAGKVAAEAKVKTLVLNHLSPADPRVVDDGVWIEKARRHFTGEMIVAHDGLTL